MAWKALGMCALRFALQPARTMDALRANGLTVAFGTLVLLSWTLLVTSLAFLDHRSIVRHGGYCACHDGLLPPALLAIAAGPIAAASILLGALFLFVTAKFLGGKSSYLTTAALSLGSSLPVLLLVVLLESLSFAGFRMESSVDVYISLAAGAWCLALAIIATAGEHDVSATRALAAVLAACGGAFALLALRFAQIA